MWGYNTNMGQFGGPMTPRMNMGGGPRGFSPWMQGIPNGFTPPNFANNMGEVFGGMPGGGGPMQFNMGSQPGKMPGQMRPPMPDMSGATNRKMEIPPHIAQILGYTKPTNDIGRESPPSKGTNGWLNNMLRSNPYMGGMNRGPQSMGMGMGLGMGMSNGLLGPGPSTPGVDVNSPQAKAGQQAMLSYLQSRFTPDQLSRMMMQGGGRGTGVPNPLGYSSLVSPQQAQQLMGMFGGGGMGNPNAPYSTNPNHMVYM